MPFYEVEELAVKDVSPRLGYLERLNRLIAVKYTIQLSLLAQ